jgi:hypothetical protein
LIEDTVKQGPSGFSSLRHHFALAAILPGIDHERGRDSIAMEHLHGFAGIFHEILTDEPKFAAIAEASRSVTANLNQIDTKRRQQLPMHFREHLPSI